MQGIYPSSGRVLEQNDVYAHAVQLLGQHVDSPRDAGYIHLDLGCGFGRLAEHVRDGFGLTYVGVDADAEGVKSLEARGFEAHRLTFSDYGGTLASLRAVCGERKIASVTMLDALHHLPIGDDVLRAIREIISSDQAVFVLSVPNVTHRDIGNKLAFGRWDYAGGGLPERTHTRFFSDASLKEILGQAGLRVTGSHDVMTAVSNQHFPLSHPALAKATLLHEMIAEVRGNDPTATTSEFVRACVAGARTEPVSDVDERDAVRPFLSIVLLTQARPEYLAETLICLSGQSDRDFELIVVGNKLTELGRKSVERSLEDLPQWLQGRLKLRFVAHENRSRALNEGFSASRGHYISILVEGDTVFANWIELFRRYSELFPGRMIRSASGTQDAISVSPIGTAAVRAISTVEKLKYSSFDFLEHLRENRTPLICIAFPRGGFHDLGIRFDEELTADEDWDYVLRLAPMTGVSEFDDVSSIYRSWRGEHQSSQAARESAQWQQNHERILERQDRRALLLPPKSAHQIRSLLDERDWLRVQWYASFVISNERRAALREVLAVLDSRSWRWTASVRWAARVLGRGREVRLADCAEMSLDELRSLAERLKLSTSWKFTAPLRGGKRA